MKQITKWYTLWVEELPKTLLPLGFPWRAELELDLVAILSLDRAPVCGVHAVCRWTVAVLSPG